MFAYLKLWQANHYRLPLDQDLTMHSSITRSVYDLDASFVIDNCDLSYCRATATIPPNQTALNVAFILPKRLQAGGSIIAR